jgi:hypothetical protein
VNTRRSDYIRDYNFGQDFAPVRRDTIMIERGWDYLIAIKADNPGIWVYSLYIFILRRIELTISGSSLS